MKILFVVNNFYASGNGLSASARRTVKYLKEAGEDVRVLSGRNHEAQEPQPEYVLADFHVPVFDSLVQSNGYKFAHADILTITKAVQWADVVHLEEPFILQLVTARIARLHLISNGIIPDEPIRPAREDNDPSRPLTNSGLFFHGAHGHAKEPARSTGTIICFFQIKTPDFIRFAIIKHFG